MANSAYITQRDIRLANNTRSKFRGKAKVNLQYLYFPFDSSDPDVSNINRLKTIFKKERCRNCLPINRIAAEIEDDSFNESLQISNIGSPSLLLLDGKDSFHELKFPPGFQLKCLYGKHRILAAREYIKEEAKKWWIIDLYLPLEDEERRSLVEEYSNSLNFRDGIIFSKIHTYMEKGDIFAERQWWARLTPNKARRINQLLNSTLNSVLMQFLSIPALLLDFKAGIWHKVIASGIIPVSLNVVGRE
jgi:hypothetical protein